MSRRKILGVVGAVITLALVAVVGALLWRALSYRPAQKIMLSDGTAVMFYRSTYGTNYQIAYGTGWRDRVARYIPARYWTNFNLSMVQVPTDTVSSLSGATNPEMLIIWMKVFRPASAVPAPVARPAPASPPAPSVRLTILDPSGFESVAVMTVGGNGVLQPFVVPNFPRRSRSLHVRVRELIPKFLFSATSSASNSQPVIGEFELPNPSRRNRPVWTADPLPQTRTTNGLEITLAKLETGHSMGDFAVRQAPTAMFGTYSAATFDFKENGRPTSDWTIRTYQAASPAGRVALRDNIIMARSTPGRELCPFGIALWPDDPVWELTFEAVRTTNFPPEELWTIPQIPVPQPNQMIQLSATTNVNGAQFTLLGVDHNTVAISSATAAMTRQQSSPFPNQTTLSVEVTNCPADLHFALVSVQTDRGEQIQPFSSFVPSTSRPTNGPSSSRTTRYTFKLPDDCRTFNATFSITPSRYVTFRASPERVK